MKFAESVAYEFGPNRGIITYTFPEDRRPEMTEDSIALGFMTTKSDAVLLRIVSGKSSDYIEMEIVSIYNNRKNLRKCLKVLKLLCYCHSKLKYLPYE